MTRIVLIASPDPDTPDIVSELQRAGMTVLERASGADMVRSVVWHAPDAMVCWEPQPSPVFFESVRATTRVAPTAVVVFTSDVRAESAEEALQAGVQEWVVQGYEPNRVRPLVQLAVRRFQRDRQLQAQVTDLTQRLEERKLVDRAKGILMSARKVNEDEAFRLLRNASMQGKQRLGEVSRQVIDAAHHAEVVNRAGRLRMLSQRVVKYCALAWAEGAQGALPDGLAESVTQVDESFVALTRLLSRPTYGDLIDAAQAAWNDLRGHLDAGLGTAASRASLSVLSELDAAAEELLKQADRLTGVLESTGLAPSLRVINMAGRQRMLAQRLAKFALLAGALPPGVLPFAPQVAETSDAFERGLAYLHGIPLSSATIRNRLDAAARAWQRLLDGARDATTPVGRSMVIDASEELVALFDALTSEYEQGMQLLIG